MNLVLTYHRIVGDNDPIPGPYTLRRHELEQQLRHVVNTWQHRRIGPPLFDGQEQANPSAPRVVVTFDDGTSGHYFHAAPVLESLGLRGIFYVSTALLEREGYLEESHCRELERRGHFVESHGHEHAQLISLNQQQRLLQLKLSRQILSGLSAGRIGSLAAVGGEFDAAAVQDAQAAGFRSLRTLQWGYNRKPRSFLWQSFNIHRGFGFTSFRALMEPRALIAKTLFFQCKEALKRSRFQHFYHAFLRRSGKE